MLKRFFYYSFCVFSLVSCSFFEVKTKQVQKVDSIVDFNTVDAFPLFPNCTEIASREEQQECFQLAMAEHIYGSLNQYSFNSREKINDTVYVKLVVNDKGETNLSKIHISPKTNELLPEFDSLVRVSLQNLPKLQPAIKRDMPVSTEFTLPIILTN